MPLLRDNLLKQKDRYEKGRGETAFVISRDDNGKSTESNINGNNRNIEKDGAYWRPSNKKQRSSLQDTDNGEITEGTFGDRRGSEHLGSASRGGLLASTRYSLREESTPTRYSLQSGDMPFFDDNGDIITFDNTDITGEDYDAVELRSPMSTTPRTTEDVIKAHLSVRHNTAKERIRRESRVLRDAVRKQYREEQIRRREGVETMRTNAAKVDYIVGAPIETLPLLSTYHYVGCS